MQIFRRFSPTGKFLLSVSVLFAASPLQNCWASIDWNWPNNQIPSDQKQIDKAYAAYQEGDIDTAILTLNGIKGAQQFDCRARHILAEIYLDTKRYGEAKRELQEMYQVELNLDKANTAKIGWVNPPQIRLEYAQACDSEGSHSEAINIYRELQNSNANWVEPRYYMAQSYELQGDHEQARNHYKALLESGVPMTYSYKQVIEQRLKRMQDALSPTTPQQQTAHSNAPHTSDPSSARPITTLNDDSGASRPMSSSFANSASFSRPVAPVQTNKATTLKAGPLEDASIDIRNRKYEAAINRLKDYLSRQPKDGQAHYLLAVAYASTRQYALARDAYEKTLQYGEISLQRLATIGLSKLPKI